MAHSFIKLLNLLNVMNIIYITSFLRQFQNFALMGNSVGFDVFIKDNENITESKI